MRKRIIVWTAKILVTIIAFSIIFFPLNRVLAPKYMGESTSMVDGLSALDKDSLDYLFLGASQMFCGVNAQKLTEEYGLRSYCYGASSQPIPVTLCYLQEALKKQHPKMVIIEMSSAFFEKGERYGENTLAWSFYPLQVSVNKFRSLMDVTENNFRETFKYCFPAFSNASSWKSFQWAENICYLFREKSNITRGFLARDNTEPLAIAFLGEDEGNKVTISQDNADAILAIAKICRENDIELMFLKVPVSNWTRLQSKTVKEFMDENNFEFFEMNDYLEEIGIDGNSDFYDESHLNSTGAKKTTDYLAQYLLAR